MPDEMEVDGGFTPPATRAVAAALLSKGVLLAPRELVTKTVTGVGGGDTRASAERRDHFKAAAERLEMKVGAGGAPKYSILAPLNVHTIHPKTGEVLDLYALVCMDVYCEKVGVRIWVEQGRRSHVELSHYKGCMGCVLRALRNKAPICPREEWDIHDIAGEKPEAYTQRAYYLLALACHRFGISHTPPHALAARFRAGDEDPAGGSFVVSTVFAHAPQSGGIEDFLELFESCARHVTEWGGDWVNFLTHGGPLKGFENGDYFVVDARGKLTLAGGTLRWQNCQRDIVLMYIVGGKILNAVVTRASWGTMADHLRDMEAIDPSAIADVLGRRKRKGGDAKDPKRSRGVKRKLSPSAFLESDDNVPSTRQIGADPCEWMAGLNEDDVSG